MPRISTDNYDTVASWNGSQDLFIVEQPDGTKVATPAMIKQYVLGNSIDDIYSVMGQNGAKNFINYPYYDPSGRTNRGITYTYDKDGIITANGSTDANNQSYMTLDDFSRGLVLPSTKKYTLTCEKTNDNNKGFAVLYFKNADNTAKTVSIHAVYEDGTTRNANSDYVSLLYNNVVHTSVTFWVDTDTIYITQARFHTNSGTITNAVLKPMLRLAEDTDDTYQPYAMTNKQLTDELDTAREQIAGINSKIGSNSGTLTQRILLSASGNNSYTVTSDSAIMVAQFEGYLSAASDVFDANVQVNGLMIGLLGVREGVACNPTKREQIRIPFRVFKNDVIKITLSLTGSAVGYAALYTT